MRNYNCFTLEYNNHDECKYNFLVGSSAMVSGRRTGPPLTSAAADAGAGTRRGARRCIHSIIDSINAVVYTSCGDRHNPVIPILLTTVIRSSL